MYLYPTISQDLLKEAINFVKMYWQTDDYLENILFHARKSLLAYNKDIWIKRNGADFDVTMGSPDGAETCELIGLYMLSLLAPHIGTGTWVLYRDDGILVSKLNVPSLERLKTKICSILKTTNLK